MRKPEDIIFSYVALEGVLKTNGCYDLVIKCMEEYASERLAEYVESKK